MKHFFSETERHFYWFYFHALWDIGLQWFYNCSKNAKLPILLIEGAKGDNDDDDDNDEVLTILMMDVDNRVILNCGGIRHEVYKLFIIYFNIIINKLIIN